MTFPERSAAVTIAALVVVFGAYFALLAAIGDARIGGVAYKPLLALAVVALIIVMAGSHIVLALLSVKDANAFDERDRMISQRADQLGAVVLGVSVLSVISLVIVEVEHVYIANALLLGLVVSQLTSESARLWLYRRSA
ncbi:MAG: hypothetical protein AAGA99_19400 [Actinomycetota bacterium]